MNESIFARPLSGERLDKANEIRLCAIGWTRSEAGAEHGGTRLEPGTDADTRDVYQRHRLILAQRGMGSNGVTILGRGRRRG